MADGKPKIKGRRNFIFLSGRPPGRCMIARPEQLLSDF
ncbi:hypothetical protein SS05631_c40430 [Sinorhizobium sp. CCBAU 05631]|nr:hypothetical protein SS05631_c40430 [Sinorhizobium sp. CCBAU 05631]